MIPLLLAVLFVVGGTLAYVALRNAQDFSDANELIPGVPTNAPREWAGAHSPEARLHRRLRDTMGALRTNQALDDPSLGGIRAELERHALAVDDQLVAVAGLAKAHREVPLLQVASAVEEIEATVADIVALRGPAQASITDGVGAIRIRLGLIAEARAELAALAPGAPVAGPGPDHDESSHDGRDEDRPDSTTG